MIETELPTYLQAYAGLSSLGFKLYPDQAPPDAVSPFGILRRAPGGGRLRTMAGPTGMASPIMEIEVQATTAAARNATATQVRLALDGYCLADGNMGSVVVHSIAMDDEAERTDFDYQSKKFIQVLPFRIWFEEAQS